MAVSKGFNIRAILGLETKRFTKGLKQARGGLTGFQKGLRSTNDILRGLQFAAIGVTAVGAFTRAINVMKTFQDEMARVQVLSNATPEQFERISAKARELGATTRFSASEAASGFQFLAMAGLDADQALATIESTLNLAGSSMIDMGTSADILTNLMSGFNIEAAKSTEIADLLAHTTSVSNTNLIQLYEGMKEAAPIATTLGVEIDEVAQAMALLANRGVQGQRAGVGLSGIMTRISRQSSEVTKSLDELGITVDENTIKQKGLIGTLMFLRDAGMSAKQMSNIFGLHIKTVGALMGVTNEEVAKYGNLMNDANGRSKEMSEEGIGAISNALKLLNSALEEMFIKMGFDGFSGFLTTVLGLATDLVRWLSTLSKETILFQGALILLVAKQAMVVKGIRTLVVSFKLYQRAVRQGTLTTKAFGVALKGALGPIGGLLLLIEGGYLVFNNISKKFRMNYEDLDNVSKKVKEVESNYEKLFQQLDAGTLTDETISQQTEVNELNKLLEDATFKYKILKEEFGLAPELVTPEGMASLKELETTISNIKNQISEINEIAGGEGSFKKFTEDLDEWKKTQDQIYKERKAAQDEDEEANKRAFEWATKIGGANKEPALKLVDDESFEKLIDGTLSQALLESSESAKILKENADNNVKALQDLADNGFDYALSALADFGQGMSNVTGNDKIAQWANFAAAVADNTNKIIGILALANASEEAFTIASLFRSQKKVTANTAEAASNAAKDSSSIPFGFIAIPAVIASVMAMFAALPKFATGGIFGGNSFSGDKNLARVNSGEMILNKAQQANLFQLANSGGGGGQVEFRIKGVDLVGVQENYRRKKKITG